MSSKCTVWTINNGAAGNPAAAVGFHHAGSLSKDQITGINVQTIIRFPVGQFPVAPSLTDHMVEVVNICKLIIFKPNWHDL